MIEAKANGETVLVLANFFNSLLSSKKQPGRKSGGESKITSRNKAAAEIGARNQNIFFY